MIVLLLSLGEIVNDDRLIKRYCEPLGNLALNVIDLSLLFLLLLLLSFDKELTTRIFTGNRYSRCKNEVKIIFAS